MERLDQLLPAGGFLQCVSCVGSWVEQRNYFLRVLGGYKPDSESDRRTEHKTSSATDCSSCADFADGRLLAVDAHFR